MIPDLETLFTHPRFWAVTTATPVQRAFCRIIDGRPLAELSANTGVRWAVGGDVALAVLAPGGSAPKQVSIYAGVRGGKSDLAACLAFRASQTVDLAPVRPHEVPRIAIVSLTADLGRVAFGHLLGRLHQPALRPLLVDEGKEHVTVRHPSGHAIEIRVVAGARAGGSLVARWMAGCIFDEKPRMLADDSGHVVNYDDALAAVEGRLLPGAQVVDLGSPWAPWGPAWDDVQERWGHPSRHQVVLRATGPMLNPVWWTESRCRDMQQKNPDVWATDGLGEFAAGTGTSAFAAADVEAAFALEVPANDEAGPYVVSIDLSAQKHHASALMVSRWIHPSRLVPKTWYNPETYAIEWNPDAMARPVLEVAHVEHWSPSSVRGAVTAEFIADRVVALARKFEAVMYCQDQYEQASFPALVRARYPGFRSYIATWSGGPSGTKGTAIDRLHGLLVARQLKLPAEGTTLREELLRFRRVVTTSGEKFEAATGQTHGDSASCLITLLIADLDGRIPSSPMPKMRGWRTEDPYTGEVESSD